jgi:hypothetical protein
MTNTELYNQLCKMGPDNDMSKFDWSYLTLEVMMRYMQGKVAEEINLLEND